jgi:membrane protein required for colicin V production
MEWIDIAILAIIGIGAFKGYRRGFIHQLASIAGWIAGFLVARAFYLFVAEKLALYIFDTPVTTTCRVVAFVAVWIIVPLLFTLIASFFTLIAKKLSLGGFNRILGFLFGMAKWALVVGLLINALDVLDTDSRLIGQTRKKESMLYYPVKNTVGCFLPVAKEVTNKYINPKNK